MGSLYCVKCTPAISRENLLQAAKLGRIATHRPVAEARRAASRVKQPSEHSLSRLKSFMFVQVRMALRTAALSSTIRIQYLRDLDMLVGAYLWFSPWVNTKICGNSYLTTLSVN